MRAFIFTQTTMRAKTLTAHQRMRALLISLRAMTPGSVDNAQNIIPKYNQSTNACIDIYSNKNVRKNLEGKPMLENPMCAWVITLRAVTPGAIDNAQNNILR